MSTPSPSNVGHGADEEKGKATKKLKAEAGEDDGAGAIKIKVDSLASQTADVVWFRIKRDVKLGRLMDMCCSKHSLHPRDDAVFLDPEGRVIRPYQTPDEAGLKDGDEIYMLLTHEGRSFTNIKVQSQIADDVVFRVKRDVKLRRLMDMYCGKHSLHPLAVRFLDPGGRPIRPNQTPDEVGLKHGDAINVVLAFINIKVHSEMTAEDDVFRIKRDLKLQRLMDMYCGKHSLHPKDVAFLDPKGRIIRPNQTPDEVGLEDGDTIDIQEGGLGAWRERELEICMTAGKAFPAGLIRH